MSDWEHTKADEVIGVESPNGSKRIVGQVHIERTRMVRLVGCEELVDGLRGGKTRIEGVAFNSIGVSRWGELRYLLFVERNGRENDDPVPIYISEHFPFLGAEPGEVH